MPNPKALTAIAIAFALSGCAPSTLEPIRGSITYSGQPRTKLTKSPIGSTFDHKFIGPGGDQYVETYRIAPDRSLELLSRYKVEIVDSR
jgi:hypothetical protein